MTGSNWLSNSSDVIHECAVLSVGLQGKMINLGDCKHLLALCVDFDNLL